MNNYNKIIFSFVCLFSALSYAQTSEAFVQEVEESIVRYFEDSRTVTVRSFQNTLDASFDRALVQISTDTSYYDDLFRFIIHDDDTAFYSARNAQSANLDSYMFNRRYGGSTQNIDLVKLFNDPRNLEIIDGWLYRVIINSWHKVYNVIDIDELMEKHMLRVSLGSDEILDKPVVRQRMRSLMASKVDIVTGDLPENIKITDVEAHILMDRKFKTRQVLESNGLRRSTSETLWQMIRRIF